MNHLDCTVTEARQESLTAPTAESTLGQREELFAATPGSSPAGQATLAHIVRTLSPLWARGRAVLGIGIGRSAVSLSLIDLCSAHGHMLFLADSALRLASLPERSGVSKLEGRFPNECSDFIEEYRGRIDAILCFSVTEEAFADGHLLEILEGCVDLLATGGRLLLAGIPNQSMRSRSLGSGALTAPHPNSVGAPNTAFRLARAVPIDDAVVLGLLLSARLAGFHGFVVPHEADGSTDAWCEDLLIVRP